MKKIMLTVIVVIFIIVIILTGLITWTNSTDRRINVNSFSVSKLTDKEFAISNTVENLSINVRTAKVKITSGDASKVFIKNVSKDQYQIENNNHKLTVFQKNSSSHNLEIGKSPEMLIVIPKRMKNINVEQLNGTLKLDNLDVGSLEINHQNGTTLSNDLKVEKQGTISKKNGKTSLDNLAVSGLKVSVKNGAFTLNGSKKISSNKTYDDHQDQGLTINSGSGQVNVKTK